MLGFYSEFFEIFGWTQAIFDCFSLQIAGNDERHKYEIKDILEMEMKLLEALDYYLVVYHPYRPLSQSVSPFPYTNFIVLCMKNLFSAHLGTFYCIWCFESAWAVSWPAQSIEPFFRSEYIKDSLDFLYIKSSPESGWKMSRRWCRMVAGCWNRWVGLLEP